MDKDFWHRRWAKREIGFHNAEVHHFLQRFLPRLNLPAGSRILIPLCGKSLDMLWLCQQGYELVGVELSRQAIEEFFQENHLQASITRVDGFDSYQFENLTIYAGDFFSLTTKHTGKIDAVYDRGALVAFPPEMRLDYVRQLRQLVTSGSQMLTISYDFDQRHRPGPPFSVPQENLAELYGDWCNFEKIHTESTLEKHQMLKAAGVETLFEEVYQIRVD